MPTMSPADLAIYLTRTGLTIPECPAPPAKGPQKARAQAGGGKAGEKAEQALCGWLDILGIGHVEQYPWGAYLTPPRKFRADLAIPAARLLIEIMGGAHVAGKERLNRDNERTRLAVHAGWTILPYPPEMAIDGSASLDIQKYLEARK